jgi:hypothetical protein
MEDSYRIGDAIFHPPSSILIQTALVGYLPFRIERGSLHGRYRREENKEYITMDRVGFNGQPIITIVIGLLLIWLVFRVIKGALRLGLTLVIIAVVAYLVLNALR